jgi:hypothetical protein
MYTQYDYNLLQIMYTNILQIELKYEIYIHTNITHVKYHILVTLCKNALSKAK